MITEESLLFTTLLAGSLASVLLVSRMSRRERELGRFSDGSCSRFGFFLKDIERLIRWWSVMRRTLLRRLRRIRVVRRHDASLEPLAVETGPGSPVMLEVIHAVAAFCILLAFFRYGVASGLPLAFAMSLLAWAAPSIVLMTKRSSQERALKEDLPFVLDALRVGLEAGQNPLRNLEQIADIFGRVDRSNSLPGELRRLSWWLRMRGDRDQGLDSMHRRISNREISTMLEQIHEALGNTVGGNGALEALRDRSHALLISDRNRSRWGAAGVGALLTSLLLVEVGLLLFLTGTVG